MPIYIAHPVLWWASSPSGSTARVRPLVHVGPIQLQPSEFAVIGLIIAIAAYCDRRTEEGLAWKDVFKLLILAGIPIGLVLIQPDLGTAIIMMIVLLIMLAVAGLPFRILVLLVIGVAFGAGGRWKTGLLHAYQIARLTTFLHPNCTSTNPHVAAAIYNTDRGQERDRLGGLFGTGLLHGAQTNLGYVPEQSTDFIFTAVGEQLGFVGRRGAAVAARCDRLEGSARGGTIPRRVRSPGLHRTLHLRGLQRLPERRHDDGDHAHHRYPAPLRQLRGNGGTLLLPGGRAGPQCGRPAKAAPVTECPTREIAPLAAGLPGMDVEDVSLDLPSQFPL